MKENMTKQDLKSLDSTFEGLLESPSFRWDKSEEKTIKTKLNESVLLKAKEIISTLRVNLRGETSDVVATVSKRAESWGYLDYLNPYKNINTSLDVFIQSLAEKTAAIEVGDNPTLIANKWVAETLLYEAKRINGRKNNATEELEKIKQRVLSTKQRQLKTDPTNDGYGDSYNREVCKIADKLEISLPEANKIFDQQLLTEISEKNLIDLLINEYRSSKLKSLKISLEKFLRNGMNPDKAIKLACILFEIDLLETDDVWGGRKFTETLIKGLNGETVELITMLCLINKFDYNGGYTSETDIFAYKKNPKLEAIPIIVDEMALLPEFFSFYGINTSLTVYVADTDYTEIGEFGPVNESNIKNINQYISNVSEYLSSFSNIQVIPISEITNGNEQYNVVKTRVLKNVKNFKDIDFSREWWQKFENDVERRFESQTKRKLFPKDQIRRKTLELTRNIWACNAAQGAVLGTLGPNTILVSTERRERDQNYIIDKTSRENFPPVLYILKAAEEWNRKLTIRKMV